MAGFKTVAVGIRGDSMLSTESTRALKGGVTVKSLKLKSAKRNSGLSWPFSKMVGFKTVAVGIRGDSILSTESTRALKGGVTVTSLKLKSAKRNSRLLRLSRLFSKMAAFKTVAVGILGDSILSS